MTDNPALALVGLRKRFGGTAALNGLDLVVPAGAFFGLLGPNGAGKSTLIGTVTGLVDDVSGTIRVFGAPAGTREASAALGLAEQEDNLDRTSTVFETLVLHGRLFEMKRADAKRRAVALVEEFGLTDKRAALAGSLSGGQRRRLMLARALMHTPRLVILDEPTASVDVRRRVELWKHMRRIHDAGATVLLTTHDLEEAAELCDHAAFIDQGRIVAQGTVKELCHRHRADTLGQLYERIVKEDS